MVLSWYKLINVIRYEEKQLPILVAAFLAFNIDILWKRRVDFLFNKKTMKTNFELLGKDV